MASQAARQLAKDNFTQFLSQAFVPHEIQRRVEKALGVRTNPAIMAKALKDTQDKVRLIMEHLADFNSQAFGLSVPGPNLFEVILLGEYACHHALAGEKAAKRHLCPVREAPESTLLFCLNMMGFFSPEDLKPYRRIMRRRIENGDQLWQRMDSLLEAASESE